MIKAKLITVVLIVLAAFILLPGCDKESFLRERSKELSLPGHIKEPVSKVVEENAKKLLGRYNLHIASKMKLNDSKKNAKLHMNGFDYAMYEEASRKIGLDMKKGRGKNLDSSLYILKERSRFGDGRIAASFIYDSDNGTIYGAYLTAGLTGGVQAFNDHDFLSPKDLKPEKLSFEQVEKIELFKIDNRDSSPNKVFLTNKRDIDRFISLLEKSKGEVIPKNDDFIYAGKEEYRIWLYYSYGPVVGIYFIPDQPSSKLFLDAYENLVYRPPRELSTMVKELTSPSEIKNSTGIK